MSCSIGALALQVSTYLSILIIAAVVIYAIFGFKKWVKQVLTILLIVITGLHYTYLYIIATMASTCTEHYTVNLYPFIIIESTSKGGVVYPDIGQLALLLLIITWYRELRSRLKRE